MRRFSADERSLGRLDRALQSLGVGGRPREGGEHRFEPLECGRGGRGWAGVGRDADQGEGILGKLGSLAGIVGPVQLVEALANGAKLLGQGDRTGFGNCRGLETAGGLISPVAEAAERGVGAGNLARVG